MRLRQVDPGDEFLRSTQGAVDLVHNLARRLAIDDADAEDLVQETYLRAWQAWSAGTRPRRIEPWLATICLNAGRDRLRHKGRHPEVLLADPDTAYAEIDVAEEAVLRVQVADVEAALAEIAEPQRIAVVLSDLCGLTAKEVADVMSCPLGTALARIHRGRKAIAQRLGVGGERNAHRS